VTIPGAPADPTGPVYPVDGLPVFPGLHVHQITTTTLLSLAA